MVMLDATCGAEYPMGANVTQPLDMHSARSTPGSSGANLEFDVRFDAVVEYGRTVGLFCSVGGPVSPADDCAYFFPLKRAIIGYNVYRGWYEGKPDDFAACIDKLHTRFPERKLAISEYGAGAGIHQHEWPVKKPAPRGPWHPEEWQAVLHEITWKSIEERPYLCGSFLWNMFDFGSDGRAEGDSPGRNHKGLVTFDGKVKKDAFFWYKANWNREPMVHVTSKRYSPRPPGPTTVKVYSNCERVALTVNGRPLGVKTSPDKV